MSGAAADDQITKNYQDLIVPFRNKLTTGKQLTERKYQIQQKFRDKNGYNLSHQLS